MSLLPRILSLLTLSLLICCGNPKEEHRKNITELETKLINDSAPNIDKEILDSLVSQYADFIHAYPDDPATPGYLFEAGKLSKDYEMLREAVEYFRLFLTQFPDHELVKDAGLLIENIKVESSKQIIRYETKLMNDTAPRIDYQTSGMLVKQYADFAFSFPNDPKTPEYFFQAGHISKAIQKPNKAIDYFQNVYDNYPEHERAAISIFLIAFSYETMLNQDDEALKYYQKFLDEFPDHELAKDARFSIEHIGISEEELIRMFEKNRSGQKDAEDVKR